MKLYKSRRAFLIQQKIADVIGDRFCRRQCVEGRKGANAEVFTRSAVARRTRPSTPLLLDHLIRPQEHRPRDGEADQLEYRRLLDRQFARLRAFEDS